jgi:hypothetical protein
VKEREKPHTDKYKEIMNDWNYDARCITSIFGPNNIKHLIFVAQSVACPGLFLLDHSSDRILPCQGTNFTLHSLMEGLPPEVSPQHMGFQKC